MVGKKSEIYTYLFRKVFKTLDNFIRLGYNSSRVRKWQQTKQEKADL